MSREMSGKRAGRRGRRRRGSWGRRKVRTGRSLDKRREVKKMIICDASKE